MKTRTYLFAAPLVGGVLAFACSADPSSIPSTSSNDTTTGDDMTLVASSDTTNAIGVTHWGAKSAGGSTTVHGYDAANELLVTLTHTVTNVSAQESTIKDTVGGSLGSAALAVRVVAGEADASGNFALTSTVTTNTFRSGGGPSTVLAAALADQGSDANWTEAKAAAGTSLETHALHPDDVALSSTSSSGSGSLTSSSSGSGSSSLLACVDATLSCVKSVASAVATGFKAATSCSGLASDIAQTVECAIDPGTGNTNLADGGLRGPAIRGAKCSSPSTDTTTTAANGCVQDAMGAVEGGADAVDACAQIADCQDGGAGHFDAGSSSTRDSGSALKPAGS